MSWSINNNSHNLVKEVCPEIEKEGMPVILGIDAFGKIVTLLKKYPELEWGAYLIGEERKNDYYIKDLILMKQNVTGTSVEFIEDKFPDNCIGWIHSHNSMDSYLSSTDSNTSQIYKISIVVNNEFKFKCCTKKELPCSRCGLIKSELKIEGIEIDTGNIIENKEETVAVTSWCRKKREIDIEKIPSEICAVCNHKLSNKKSKLFLCSNCERYVHAKCFVKGNRLCRRCDEKFVGFEEKEYKREKLNEQWREYLQDNVDFYG